MERFSSKAGEVTVLLSDDTQETLASTRTRLRTKARSTHCPGLPYQCNLQRRMQLPPDTSYSPPAQWLPLPGPTSSPQSQLEFPCDPREEKPGLCASAKNARKNLHHHHPVHKHNSLRHKASPKQCFPRNIQHLRAGKLQTMAL